MAGSTLELLLTEEVRAEPASTPWSLRCRTSTAAWSASASTGEFFLEEIARRRACTCATTCSLATWRWTRRPGMPSRAGRRATGTFTRCPIITTLRRAAWLEGTAIVLCDALYEDRRRSADRGLAAPHPAPSGRAGDGGAGSHPSTAKRARVLPVRRELCERARARVPRAAHEPGLHRGLPRACRAPSPSPSIGAIRAGRRCLRASRSSSARGSGAPGQHEINLRYAPRGRDGGPARHLQARGEGDRSRARQAR